MAKRAITFPVALSTSALTTLVLLRFSTLPTTSAITYPVIAAIGVWILYGSFLYPLYLSPLRRIPTVPGCPLWGHAYHRMTNELGVPEREWHKTHGNIFRYFLPFGFERVCIADDDMIKEVTIRNPYNFVKPAMIVRWMKGVLGEQGILLVDGEQHARQRKMLAPAFSTASIRQLEPGFWSKGLLMTDILANEIRNAPDSDSSAGKSRRIEMLSWLNRATLDVIGSVAFGYEIGSLADAAAPLRKAYSAVFEFDVLSAITHLLRIYVEFGRYVPTKMNRDMEASIVTIRDSATEIVRAKLAGKTNAMGSKDIIGLTVRRNESLAESDGDRLSFEAIRDQVMTFTGAGHDTTATGVAWTLLQLSKHSEAQDRLRDELHAALPMLRGGPCDVQELTKSNIDRLHYLSNVCQESLRVIPPVPTIVREVLVDTRLGGYLIPSGTLVNIVSNAVNHLPCYWGDTADLFDPDRWDALPDTWLPNAFQTFLEGPRGCIGRKFAETEMKVFCAVLVSRFKFELDGTFPDPEKEKFWRLVLRPKNGIRLKMSLVE